MLKILQNPLLKRLPGIGHAFFTRQGGVSEGIYAGLNCDENSQDNPLHIAQNQRLALQHLGRSPASFASYRACHGNVAVIVEQPNTPFPEADAIVTSQPNIILGADSADCPTVLFADPIAKVIGLAHAGWRSALNGILEATLAQMLHLGANVNNISAVIGPGIAKQSYEVSLPFYQQFMEADIANAGLFYPAGRPHHWLFDLPGYVQIRLERLKLPQIAAIGLDTYTHADWFYSCRRSYHQGQTHFGGHLACIYFTTDDCG